MHLSYTEAAKLASLLEEHDHGPEELDEVVHELYAAEASERNNCGLIAQLGKIAEGFSSEKMFREYLISVFPDMVDSFEQMRIEHPRGTVQDLEKTLGAEISTMWQLRSDYIRSEDHELLRLLTRREEVLERASTDMLFGRKTMLEMSSHTRPVISTRWPAGEHHGDIIFVPILEDEDSENSWLEELRAAGFSEDFIHICLLAQQHGVHFIKFDRDGGTVFEHTLPLFEW
jgi:hypothetical protein